MRTMGRSARIWQRAVAVAALGLAATGAVAAAAAAAARDAPAAPEGASAWPYVRAVADRFPAPSEPYDTPGLQPGRSDWTDNDELEATLRAIAARGAAQLLTVGHSESGRAILALRFARAGAPSADADAAPSAKAAASADASPSADAAAATAGAPVAAPRPLALLVGQQHGNEPAGAEALLIVARRLADAASPLAAVLDELDVVVLPRANPDGAAHGRRANGAGLDINRDHLRLLTAEAGALADLVREQRPVLVVDVHEYAALSRGMARFGGIKRHDMLWQYATTPGLPDALAAATEAWFGAPLRQALAAADLNVDWYHTNPAAGDGLRLSMGGLQPDLARNAFGLKHAVSVLLESRGFDLGRLHAQRRVHSHVVALASLLASAAGHGPALRALQASLDAEAAAQACRGDAVLAAAPTRLWRPLLLLDPATGADKSVMVDWGSALALQPLATRARPCGYWLAADAADVVARLRRHGVAVQALAGPQRLQGERYRPTVLAEGAPPRGPDPSPPPRRASLALVPETFDAPAGSYYVPLDQALSALVMAALEPDAPSSWFAYRLVPRLDAVRRVVAPP